MKRTDRFGFVHDDARAHRTGQRHLQRTQSLPIANVVVTVRILAPRDGKFCRTDNLHAKALEEKLGI